MSIIASGLLNDMVVDFAGRAYIGDTGYDINAGEPEQPGRLLLCAADAKPRVVAEEIEFPNGLAISQDGRTLYLAETFGRRVTTFRINPNGDLDDRRVHSNLPGIPDGLCIDRDGAVWVALLEEHRFIRIAASGAIVDSIECKPWRAVACMLGGEDGTTLYMCLAEIDSANLDGKPARRGQVCTTQVAVPRAGWP